MKPCAQWTQLWSDSAENAGPPPRAAHGLVVHHDHLYMYGGVRSSDPNAQIVIEMSDTWKFDLNQRQWTQIVNDSEVAPSSRYHHSSALHTNASVAEMIVFGGLDVDSTMRPPNVSQFNDVWRLKLPQVSTVSASSSATTPAPTFRWTRDNNTNATALAPQPRSEATAVVYKDQLIIFGGITYNVSSTAVPVDYNDLWSYDLGTRQWRRIEPADDVVPPTRFSHSASLLTDHNNVTYLLVVSGRRWDQHAWSLLDDVWLFSFDERVWLPVTTSSSLQRAYTSVIVQDSTMWLFGGYYRPDQGQNGYVFNDVVSGNVTMINSTARTASMELVQHSMSSRRNSPLLRYDHHAVLWQHQMIIHGGSFQAEFGDVWSFALRNASFQQPVPTETTDKSDLLLIYIGTGVLFLASLLLVGWCIRWHFRSQRQFDRARQLGFAAMQGVSKERMAQLEVCAYHRAPGVDEEDACPICLVGFEEGDQLRKMPCKHLFHVPCIDEWLTKSKLCPMCKGAVEEHVDDRAASSRFASYTRGGAVVVPLPGTPQ
ncbi:TPA: hypothetical protein N0F65_012461 [Lagenidium giganteum]|uniref:RING-type domain-containing protein n=1 Tax=Lagenidium giganteum TaxID=4803 RepID=A0AAV2YH04_9STRA|nr:TPA: hypothetical protein N0F65_012461 [Lagenidium giganteum]